MESQRNLNKTIELLKSHSSYFPEVEPLLNGSATHVSFFDFTEPSATTSKEHILDIYETRAAIEQRMRKDNPLVKGYDILIPGLRSTGQDHICISDIETNIGSFIVFSDFNRTELIGVLVSK